MKLLMLLAVFSLSVAGCSTPVVNQEQEKIRIAACVDEIRNKYIVENGSKQYENNSQALTQLITDLCADKFKGSINR